MKGGVGCASVRLGQVVIAALVVVNAAGDIVDWRRGTIVAGARTSDGRGFARTVDVLRRDLETRGAANAPLAEGPLRATTLGVVATNVAFTKTELTKLAMMANTGAARAIHPYHTQSDGDQMLAVSTGCVDGQRIANGVWRDRRRSRGGRHRARSDDRDERHRLDCGPRFVNCYSPKHTMVEPTARAMNCCPPTAKVIGEVLMVAFSGTRHNVFPSRSSTATK